MKLRRLVHIAIASSALAGAIALSSASADAASATVPNDRWAPWLASEAQCPGAEDANAPARAQVRTLLCLANYARGKQRLRPLVLSPALSSASTVKARDIARCGVFEHGPCGKAPDSGARAAGYAGAWGENLFFGTGSYGAPRIAVHRWLKSRAHRLNLFRPQWRTIGIARRARVKVGRVRNAVIWVNQFGDRATPDSGA